MKELEEIYNRLYDEYIDARREHFESALDMKKNGDRIYLVKCGLLFGLPMVEFVTPPWTTGSRRVNSFFHFRLRSIDILL